MKLSKRIIVFSLATSMILGINNVDINAGEYNDTLKLQYNYEVHPYNNRIVTIEVDGAELETGDMPAVIIDGKTMVPLREVFENEAFGAKVKYNAEMKEITIGYESNLIVLTIDSKIAYVNNKKFELKTAPTLVRDTTKKYAKTMLPLRFVSEVLGFEVKWDQNTYTASVITGKTHEDNEKDSEDEKQVKEEIKEDNNRELVKTELADSPIIWSGTSNIEGEEEITEDESSESEHNVIIEEELTKDVKNVESEKDLINIKEIIYDNKNSKFIIKADKDIKSVKASVWNSMLIVKIKNSSVNIVESNLVCEDDNPISSVRAASHDEDGYFSHIVFDLRDINSDFEVKSGNNANELEIKVTSNQINELIHRKEINLIKLGQDDISDYIDIKNVELDRIKVFRLNEPNRLVFDIKDSISLIGKKEEEVKGAFVTKIRTAQFEEDITRIVVETNHMADYEIKSLEEGKARIYIKEPGYENISYDATKEEPKIVLTKKDGAKEIHIDDIKYTDNYIEKQYIITLEGDFTNYFGQDLIKINDDVIESIDISLNSEGNTNIVINENIVREYRIEEVDGKIELKAYKPSDLYAKVLVVDAGHGGKDPGAVVGKAYEKVPTLGVTKALKKYLDKEDIKVYYTRLDDSYPTLQERCDLANEVGADFFLSLHCNSYKKEYAGTETLYKPGNDTPGLNAFELAEIFQEVFPANTLFESAKMKERDNLFVLNATEMPAMILEMGFLSNDHDRAILMDDSYYDDLAEAINKAIKRVFKEYPTGR